MEQAYRRFKGPPIGQKRLATLVAGISQKRTSDEIYFLDLIGLGCTFWPYNPAFLLISYREQQANARYAMANMAKRDTVLIRVAIRLQLPRPIRVWIVAFACKIIDLDM
jgi:hypothetical protein